MRIILHIDMDAFFASVEERDKPRLKGLPIVVGSDPADGKGRGVVSTANYAARAYGIKSAMPISRAWDKSQQAKKAGKPEVVFIEPNIKHYSDASRVIFEYIATKADAFEPASIDECYADVSSLGSYKKAEALAQEIKEWVKERQKLTCSIGVGPNKLIAKIAAGKRKPDGLMVVRDEEVQSFLDPLSVRELMGVGPKTEVELNKIGIQTIADLRKRPHTELVELFGKHGEGMFRQAQGIDDSPVSSEHETKSIGEQITFDTDTLDASIILATFKQMAQSIAKSLKKEGKRFRTIAIVVRFSDFQTQTRSHTIERASDEASVLEKESLQLLLPFLDKRENPKKKKLRLVGIRAEKLEDKGLF